MHTRRLIVPGLAFALWTAPSTSQLTAQQLPITSRTLPNGLEVVVIENHAVPIVTVELDVRNGAFTEPPEYDGLSHLYEHMYFKANRAIPSQERYLERSNELGLVWNGTTSEERVNYFFTVGVDSLAPAMQFMEDAIRSPLFLQEELERERPVVLGEFDRAEASPFFHLFREVARTLYTPAFYSHKNVIGERAIISTATQEKMRAIQQRYYVPNNTALILSGDITPARGLTLADSIFGDWPRGADPFAQPAPNPPALTRSRAVIVEKPVNSVTLLIQWNGPSVGQDPGATYAADVFSTVLRNPTSRWWKRLVDSGLAFQVDLNYYTLNHVGPISVFAQTTPDKLLALERAVYEEIRQFTDSAYFTDAQLAAARNQIAVQGAYEREQSSGFAHTVGFWWAVADLDYYLGYRRNMQAVTRSSLADYARRYLVGKPSVVGVLISPETRAALTLTPEALLPPGVVP
jgi:zinc protease